VIQPRGQPGRTAARIGHCAGHLGYLSISLAEI
jgi:hypothetical protein